VLSIPILGAGIIGSSYVSPFLFHLADITNGSNTATVASTNAPNWAIGTPIAQVATPAVATTTGSLASSTAFSVAIAAIDANGGTTTLSSAVTQSTDPDGQANEGLEVTWSPVLGASAYAIFAATGTVSNSSGFSQYFLATTSSAYLLSTTTGSRAGSYAKSDTTAFSILINPVGPDYISGPSTATSSTVASTTAFQVGGNFVATAPATTTACFAATAGAVFYNTSNNHEWGCNGTAWQKIF
jgi:hypothetical protein